MPCYHLMNIRNKDSKTGFVTVPCGRCIGCRLERSRQWAVRIMNEASMHKSNCFLTLTYRDDELTYGKEVPTLYPKHLEKFWKRLRKEYGNGIRYFACGEYGDTTYRPHYHACVFGHDFQDKRYYTTKNGNQLYNSDSLNRIWSYGHGVIGGLSFESAAYVARYVMKKHLGKDASYYHEKGIEPEFARMSRRPGIGLSWLEKYSGDVFDNDFMVVSRGETKVRCKPPRYYTEKFKLNEPEIMKARRVLQVNAMDEQRDNNTRARLRVREVVKQAAINSLARKDV